MITFHNFQLLGEILLLQQCLGEGLTVFDVDDDGNNDNSFCSYTHRFVFRYYHFGFNEKDPGFKKKTPLKEPIEIIKSFVYFKYIKQKPGFTTG